jgi:two-component system chemotaxis response regulator CheB
MAQRSINNRYDLLVIGGSAGSLEVILQLLPALQKDLNLAIVIVLHRKNGESQLAELLSDKSQWEVREAEEKDVLEGGSVYLAPADYHLMIEKDRSLSLDFSEKVHFSRPAIDITFQTAAETYGATVIAVLLSGANGDGTEGLQNVKGAGGLTIVQDPAEAAVSYMPQHAIDHVKIDYVADTKEIAAIINKLTR